MGTQGNPSSEPADPSGYGETAVRMGFLAPERLLEAAELLEKMKAMGLAEPMSRVLQKKGYLTAAQHRAILGRLGAAPAPIPGYRLIKRIGQGGAGIVYKAEQISVHRTVAIKVLHTESVKDPTYIPRFFKEAKAAAQLNHRNLIAAIDVGEANGMYYFVMEYVDGQASIDRVIEKGPFSEKEAVNIALQMADALECIRTRELVHRDIKPENILLTADGTVKLCDLGLAKSTAAAEQSLTQTGFTVGTPYYMSPEQVRGAKDVDIRSDLYSLGASLYCLVTGRPPFEGASSGETFTMHLKEPVPDPRKLAPHLSEDFAGILRKLLSKDRKDRYATPAQLAEDLRRVRTGAAPVLARAHAARTAVIEKAASTQRVVVKKTVARWPFFVAGGAVLALLAVVLVSLFAARRADSPARITEAARLLASAEERMKEGRWEEAREDLVRLQGAYGSLAWYRERSALVGEKIGLCEARLKEEADRRKAREARLKGDGDPPIPADKPDDPAWVAEVERLLAAAEGNMKEGRWEQAREALLQISSTYGSLAWYRERDSLVGEKIGICEGRIQEEQRKREMEARTPKPPVPPTPPPVSGETVAFQDGVDPSPAYAGTRDTTLREHTPDRASGSEAHFEADGDEPLKSGKDCFGLVRWDLSSVPPDRVVAAASVVLRIVDNTSAEYPAYEILRPWDEETATWKEARAGTPWEVPGAAGPGDRGSAVLARFRYTRPGWFETPFTAEGVAVVQSWIRDPSKNNGIVIASSSLTDGLDVESREAPDPRRRPRLVLVLRAP